SRSRHIRRSIPCRRRATQTRRIARNELVCGRGSHRDCRPADDCAAHARASPLQDGSSRVSLSCRWTEASTKSETFCPVVEAGSPAQSTRPCSGAANQCDPCAHGFRDWTPWQGGAEIRSLVPIGAPKMAVGNYKVTDIHSIGIVLDRTCC